MDHTPNRTALIALLIVLAVLVVLGVPMLVMAPMMGWGVPGWGMMGGYGPGGAGPGWGWAMVLVFWVLLLGGIALIAVWFARQGAPGGRAAGGPGASHPDRGENPGTPGSDRGGPAALEILKQRYARGEITRDVYEQMKRDLLAD